MTTVPTLRCSLGIVLLASGLIAPWVHAATAVPASTPAVNSSVLEFVTEELPPLNFNKDGQADGFGSELVRELLRRNDLKAPLTILPWARAYKMALIRPNIGLYCTARNKERESLFQWVGPIGYVTSRLYAMPDSSLRVSSLADAKAAGNVIALREGYSAQMLRSQGFTNILYANNNTEAVRLLMTGDGQTLLLISSMTVPETLAKLGQPSNAIKPVLLVTSKQLYIAFSLDTPQGLVKRFQETLDGMKRDGSFATIYRKWFPGEKPPGLEREANVPPE